MSDIDLFKSMLETKVMALCLKLLQCAFVNFGPLVIRLLIKKTIDDKFENFHAYRIIFGLRVLSVVLNETTGQICLAYFLVKECNF